MLLELSITDFALIRSARLELGPGLNILSGETGAGKSILTEALGLVLGDRSDSGQVRRGAESARVEAWLQPDPEGLERLRTGLEPRRYLEPSEWEQGAFHLYREVHASGRSQARLNGRPVPASVLRVFGTLLVERHGQQEGQRLLRPERQLELIDRFAGAQHWERRRRMVEAVRSLRRMQQELAGEGTAARKARFEALQAEREQLLAMKLVPGEEEELRLQHRRLENARQLLEGAAEAHQLLVGREDGPERLLGVVEERLSRLRTLDEGIGPLHDALLEVLEGYRAVAAGLERYGEQIELDGRRLAEVEQRLELLRHVRRRYGSPEAALAWLEEAARELDELEGRIKEAALAEERLAALEQEAERLAAELRRGRRDAAARIEREVKERLPAVGLPGACFQVVWTELKALQETGRDRVSFEASFNPGEPLRPIAETASGGEMSRLVLAIEAALAGVLGSSVLVLDEIDAGVAGTTAIQVARMLRDLGNLHQVLCITHLPVVAAAGNRHFAIDKVLEDGTSRTEVKLLEGEARVRELARMLGASEGIAVDHARSLLKQFE